MEKHERKENLILWVPVEVIFIEESSKRAYQLRQAQLFLDTSLSRTNYSQGWTFPTPIRRPPLA